MVGSLQVQLGLNAEPSKTARTSGDPKARNWNKD